MNNKLLTLIRKKKARSLHNRLNYKSDFLLPIPVKKETKKQQLNKSTQSESLLQMIQISQSQEQVKECRNQDLNNARKLKTLPNYHSPIKQSKTIPTSFQQSLEKQIIPQKQSVRIRQQKQLSPQQRQQFKLKLNHIEQSITQLQHRQNEYSIQIKGQINTMLKSLHKTVNVQQKKLDSPIEEIKQENLDQNFINHSFNQISETRKLQRTILRNSVYYKGSTWKQKKESIKTNIKNLKWYQRKELFASLKTPYLRDNSKQLFRAVRQKHYQEVLTLLAQNKFLIHEIDNSLQTPLHISAQFGLYDISKLLLRFNADVNSIDINGKTPLFYALANCHIELVKLLIAYDAQPWSFPKCNYAQFYSNPKLRSVMKVAKRTRTILLLVLRRRRQKIKEFLEQYQTTEYKLPPQLQ